MTFNNTVCELKRIKTMESSFLQKITEMYVERTTIYIDDIARLFKERDYDGVGSYAHKLYGSSATLGAIKIATIAKEVEKNVGKDFNNEDIKKKIDLLLPLLKEFDNFIENYLKESK